MLTAERHATATAFRTPSNRPSGVSLHTTSRAVVRGRIAVQRTEPTQAPVIAPRLRRRVNVAWSALIVFAAILVLIAGMTYLSGYARLTHEGYRRAQLKNLLRQERDVAQGYLQ